jgi:hypothetical protein
MPYMHDETQNPLSINCPGEQLKQLLSADPLQVKQVAAHGLQDNVPTSIY